MDTIVAKAVAKDKDRRYESAAALSADIRRHLVDEPIAARPPNTWYNITKFARRNRAVVSGVAVAFSALAVAVVASTASALRADSEATKATRTAEFVTDILDGVTPDRARGKDITLLREMLDEAASKIEAELSDAPEIEAFVRDQVGTIYHQMSLHDSAEEHLPRALEIRRNVLGETHYDTLMTAGRVAHLRFSQGRDDEAIELFTHVHTVFSRMYGPESRDTIRELVNLGATLRDLGRIDEAHDYLRDAVAFADKHLSRDDLIHQSAKFNYTHILSSKNRHDEAEAMCRDVLEMYRATFGNDHSRTLSTLSMLSVMLLNAGKLEESLPYATEALDVRRRIMGEDHTDTLRSMYNVGAMMWKCDRREDARVLMDEALKKHIKAYGPDHAHTLYVAGGCAILYTELEDFEAAERLARDTAERAGASLGTDDRRFAALFGKHGYTLFLTEQFSEAAATLSRAHALCADGYGPTHSETLDIAQYLVKLFERWHEAEPDAGHDRSAREWSAKLESEDSP